MTGEEFRTYAAEHRRYMKLPSPWGTGPELAVIVYDAQPPEFEDKSWYERQAGDKRYWVWPCSRDKYALALWGGITTCDAAIPESEWEDDMFCVYVYEWVDMMLVKRRNNYGFKRHLHFVIDQVTELAHARWEEQA